MYIRQTYMYVSCMMYVCMLYIYKNGFLFVYLICIPIPIGGPITAKFGIIIITVFAL